MALTPAELKALDLESSKVIDLEMFVPRGEVDEAAEEGLNPPASHVGEGRGLC